MLTALLLILLTLEHIGCGILLMLAQGVAMVLARWQRSVYRRLDRLTASAR